jgi:hypothetical protein
LAPPDEPSQACADQMPSSSCATVYGTCTVATSPNVPALSGAAPVASGAERPRANVTPMATSRSGSSGAGERPSLPMANRGFNSTPWRCGARAAQPMSAGTRPWRCRVSLGEARLRAAAAADEGGARPADARGAAHSAAVDEAGHVVVQRRPERPRGPPLPRATGRPFRGTRWAPSGVFAAADDSLPLLAGRLWPGAGSTRREVSSG